MGFPALAVALLVLLTAMAGCSEGQRNTMTVVVSNSSLADPAPVEVWLRIESVRGDIKLNEAVTVAQGHSAEIQMGDLQGGLRFTAIAREHSHTEDEQVEPDEDWHVEVRSDGSTCFRFGIDGSSPMRCG